MKHKFKRLGLLVGLGFASGIVAALPCDSVLSSYQSASTSGSFPSSVSITGGSISFSNATQFAGFLVSTHPECFGGSSATAQVQINGTSFQQVSAISRALGLRFNSDNPGPSVAVASKGMAAGNAGMKLNIWGSADNNVTNQSYLAANRSVTNNDSAKAKIASSTVQLLKAPRFSVTASE